jgi:glutathione peroxidase
MRRIYFLPLAAVALALGARGWQQSGAELAKAKAKPAKTKAPVKSKTVKAKAVQTKAQPVKAQAVQTEPVKTAPVKTAPVKTEKPMSFLDFKTQSLDGQPVDLSKFKGRVLLVVNTASKCGFTPQYAGLQKLYTDYETKGLTVVGFPANNFGGQEPGTNTEIGEFCQKNYGVTFPLMTKTSVKGDDQSPIFAFLTKEANPQFTGDIGWNFEKFLVSRDGKLVARFKSNVTPDSDELKKAVEIELAKSAPTTAK